MLDGSLRLHLLRVASEFCQRLFWSLVLSMVGKMVMATPVFAHHQELLTKCLLVTSFGLFVIAVAAIGMRLLKASRQTGALISLPGLRLPHLEAQPPEKYRPFEGRHSCRLSVATFARHFSGSSSDLMSDPAVLGSTPRRCQAHAGPGHHANYLAPLEHRNPT